MKKLLCILLAICGFVLPALAEGAPLAEDANPFAPYVLTAPEGASLEEGEGSLTFVQGNTRVVAQVISRVPDADPAEAMLRMMTQFEPFAIIGEDLPAADGFVAVTALNADKFGDGVDMITVMVLSAEGDLLILSGYDLDGDGEKAQALLDSLLETLTVDGMNIIITEE